MLGRGANSFEYDVMFPGGDASRGAVCRVRLNHSLLDGDALQVCVVQLPLPEDGPNSGWSNANHRAVAVQALADLLACRERDPALLSSFVTAQRPSVVVLPELALGSDDWPRVDELVRAYPGPLLLIAGAAYTRADLLLEWARREQPGGTQCALAVDPDEELNLSRYRRCNVGYFWIHLPRTGTTSCVAFIKNFAEQRHEWQMVQDLYPSSTILRIDALDVTLLPLVCADLVCEGQDGKAPRLRIERSLAEEPASGGRALVLGLLLQPQPENPQWRGRLAHFVDTQRRVLICNASALPPYGPHALPEDADRWRNLTGAYAPYGSKTGPAPEVLRTVLDEGLSLFGQVVRSTAACAVGGGLRWGPFDPQRGRRFWDARLIARIGEDGRIGKPTVVSRSAVEAARLVRRWLPTWKKRIHGSWVEAASDFACELEGQNETDAMRLLVSGLHGTSARGESAKVDVDALEILADVGAGNPWAPLERVATSLVAVAALRRAHGILLETRHGLKGQLTGLAGNRNVLVWSDPKREMVEMQRLLFEWLDEPAGEHPDLVVFAEAAWGESPHGPLHQHRRRDISEAPPGGSVGPEAGEHDRRIDEGARGRRAWAARLDTLVSVCAPTRQGAKEAVVALTSDACREDADVD